MAGEEAKKTNPFASYVEPNAIVPPEMYEKMGLFGLLYNAIANDLYGQDVKNSMTYDSSTASMVKKYVSVMEKILQGTWHATTKEDEKLEKNVRDYMKNYVPLDDPFNDDGSVNLATRDTNIAYIQDYLKNHTAASREMMEVAVFAKANGQKLEHGMLTRDQVWLLLRAKYDKCREFYNMVRTNCDGKPGKIDKDGSSKLGVHLRLYEEGKNKILHEKDKIRKAAAKNTGKVIGAVALWALFGAGVVFTGGALSPTLAGLVGSGMSAASIGQFFTGLVTSIVSFRGGIKVTKMASDGIKANYQKRKELKEYMGPRITKDRLEALLANYSKDGKDLTFNERKALLMFDKAAKMYFEKGKVEGEFDGEQLSKYLPQDLIKKYKYDVDAQRFRMVEKKNGSLYSRLTNKFINQPTEYVGDGSMGRGDIAGLYESTVQSKGASLDDLEKTIRAVSIGKSKIGEQNYSTFMAGLAKKVGDSAGALLFEQPLTSGYVTSTKNTLLGAPFDEALKMNGNISTQIENHAGYFESLALSDSVNPIDETLGVSLTAQLTYDKESIVAACERIDGVTLSPAEKTNVEGVVDDILALSAVDGDGYNASTGKYEEKDRVKDIENMITGLGVDGRVKKYLSHMLKKKKDTVPKSAVRMLHELDDSATSSTTSKPKDVADAIAKFVINEKGEIVTVDASNGNKPVKGYETIAAAKDTIMAMNGIELSGEQKAKAIRLLEERVLALESAQRMETLQSSIETINGSVTATDDMKGFQEKIAKIKFQEVESFVVDGQSFDELKRKFIDGKSLEVYKLQCFQQAIEKAIKERLSHTSDFTNATNGLDNVIAVMKKVNECSDKGYLSEGQAMQIVSTIEPMLASAVSAKLKDLKDKFFLSSSNPKEVYNLASNLLKYKYTDKTPGLSEYFAKKTPTTENLKSQLEYMTKLSDVYNMIKYNAGGLPGSTAVNMNEEEAMQFADVYFSKDKRDDKDGLIIVLKEMRDASSGHNSDAQYNIADKVLDESDSVYFGDTYLNKMQEILNKINGSGTLSKEEKYAALVVAKTRCVAMYKSYLMRVIQLYNSGPSDFSSASDAAALAYLEDRVLSRGWRTIFKNIEEANAGLNLGYVFNGVTATLPTTTMKTKAYGYANNPEMQPQ